MRARRPAVRSARPGRVSGSVARTTPDPRASALPDPGIHVHPARAARSRVVQGIQPVPVGTRRRRAVVRVPMAPVQSVLPDPVHTGPIPLAHGRTMPVQPDPVHTVLGRPVRGPTVQVHDPMVPVLPGPDQTGLVPSGRRLAELIGPRARMLVLATAQCMRAAPVRPSPRAHSPRAHSPRVRRRPPVRRRLRGRCRRCLRQMTDPHPVRRQGRRTNLAARRRRFVRALPGAFSGSIADRDHRRSARLRSLRRPT
jgi:hypothetical protein